MARLLQLAECPRCGGPATAWAMRFTREGTQHAVGCADMACGASTTFLALPLDDVAERWNAGVNLVRAGEPVRRTRPPQVRMVEVDA